jgi:hypothetical protein
MFTGSRRCPILKEVNKSFEGPNHRLVLLGFLCWLTGCSGPLVAPNATKILSDAREKFARKAEDSERLWRPDLTIMPFAEFRDEEIILRHVRNCRYRTETDFDVRYYDVRFPLQDVRTLDFIIVPFNNNPLLAHTMFSFGLADDRHFIISVEARLDQGESYSPVRGLTSKFQLMYVIGDERDLIPLRTSVRKAEVYLYPGRATPDQIQNLLVDMLERANKLQRVPEHYDTLNNNCTTNLVQHINKLRPGRIPKDLRVILPGHSDRLAYEIGLLDVDEPFEIARKNSRITSVAELYKDSDRFSREIRDAVRRTRLQP